MRKIGTVGSLIFFTLCFSIDALACRCWTPSAEEGFRRSDAVFIGEVIRVDDERSGKPSYTFHVSKVLKGKDVSKIVVTGSGTNCDYRFSLGTFYLVYAGVFEGKLRSGLCSGTTALGISPRQSPCLSSSKGNAPQKSSPKRTP